MKQSVQLSKLAEKTPEGPFGLGCLTNIFCAILPDSDVEVVDGDAIYQKKIHDMLLHRPHVTLVKKSTAPDNTQEYRSAVHDPSRPTKLFFSKEELTFMEEILRQISFEIYPERYLVICPNEPGFTKKKKLSVEEWIDFISEYRQEETTIIIMPTFSQTDVDLRLAKKIKETGMQVINLHHLLTRKKKFLNEIVEAQTQFGQDRNPTGLNYRQDAVLYHLIIKRDLQGLFQDSAPAHIAAAASQRAVVSDKVYAPYFVPRNGGTIKRMLKK